MVGIQESAPNQRRRVKPKDNGLRSDLIGADQAPRRIGDARSSPGVSGHSGFGIWLKARKITEACLFDTDAAGNENDGRAR
jgi:hypothetical protein